MIEKQKNEEITVNDVQNHIKNLKARHSSRWLEAVKEDAVDLLDKYIEWHGENVPFKKENIKELLNGAENWNQYSYSGLAIVDDSQIAAHYCTPSELKKLGYVDYGDGFTSIGSQPSSKETWLDVQARALRQAEMLIAGSLEKIGQAQKILREDKVETKSKAIDVVNRVEKKHSKARDDGFGLGR